MKYSTNPPFSNYSSVCNVNKNDLNFSLQINQTRGSISKSTDGAMHNQLRSRFFQTPKQTGEN